MNTIMIITSHDAVEMDEIEGESDDEVFDGDDVETEEKHKVKKN